MEYKVLSIEHKDTSKIKSFTDLRAWQKAHDLVVLTYDITGKFPVSEQYGLTSQMRRCAVSISSNIAEGFSRGTRKDKLQFYIIAIGSLTELQDQCLVARDVKLMSKNNFNKLADRSIVVHKLVTGLAKTAQTKGQ